MGKPTFDKLNEVERKVVADAAVEARDYQRKLTREQTAGLLVKLADEGMEVNDVTPEEKLRLAEHLKPVVEKNSQAIGAEWMATFSDALAKLR